MMGSFFAGPDDERFFAASPEEYLVDRFDGGVLDVELSKHIDGVEVVEYRPIEIAERDLKREAEWLVESFEEWLEDTWGGDDGPSVMPADVGAVLTQRFEAALLEAQPKLTPWQCEEVSRRTYTREEVAALLLEAQLQAKVEGRS